MKEKVVVFGGSGFLGSHVADSLSDLNYQVIIFDLSKSLTFNNVDVRVGLYAESKLESFLDLRDLQSLSVGIL